MVAAMLYHSRDFTRKFCDSRTGYEQTSQYLESWCKEELSPKKKNRKKRGKSEL
jgi:predicted RNA-binding protein with RPS1 domain